MLCLSSLSSARILLIRTNPSISATSLLLSKRFFSIPPQKTHLFLSSSSSLNQAVSSSSLSFSRSIKTGASSSSAMASHSKKDHASIHEFTVKDARGNDVDLGTYKGKVLLIVNVASQCGLTNSNYSELSQLYQKYKDQGLEILAFPCNQFGAQEPGSNEEIVEFACTRFKAEYPIFDKGDVAYLLANSLAEPLLLDLLEHNKAPEVDVNGDNAAPIYKYLKSSKGSLFGDGIKWNFAKFLIDKEGHVVDRYAPTTSPLSIEKDIKKLLGASA